MIYWNLKIIFLPFCVYLYRIHLFYTAICGVWQKTSFFKLFNTFENIKYLQKIGTFWKVDSKLRRGCYEIQNLVSTAVTKGTRSQKLYLSYVPYGLCSAYMSQSVSQSVLYRFIPIRCFLYIIHTHVASSYGFVFVLRILCWYFDNESASYLNVWGRRFFLCNTRTVRVKSLSLKLSILVISLQI